MDEEIIEVVHDQAREVQFAGDNGVVDSLQDEAVDSAPLPESKNRPILHEVLTLQSSLVAKVSVHRCCHALSAKTGATFT